MKAISLHQPWASAVAAKIKNYETRHWQTSHRGPIAIHAAKRWTREEFATWNIYVGKYGFPADPPLGAIVAIADLGDCIKAEQLQNLPLCEQQWGSFGPGRFGWRLDNIRPLRQPVQCKGFQGIWNLDADIAQAVMAML